MGMSPEIFRKTHTNGPIAVEPKVKPKQHGAVFKFAPNNLRCIVEPDPIGGPPVGSVDLMALRYAATCADEWGKGARIQDVCASIDSTTEYIFEVVRNSVNSACGLCRTGPRCLKKVWWRRNRKTRRSGPKLRACRPITSR
jgi:hypothetical protein